jgi:hypothetical protein
MTHYQIKNSDLIPLFTLNKEVAINDIDNFLINQFKIPHSKTDYLRYKLVKEGLLERTGYKKYSLRDYRKDYLPYFNERTIEIHDYIKQNKQLLKFCIWRTSILNEFTRHQVGKFMIMVEVERIGVEAVFDIIRDKFDNVFLNPTEKEMYNYILALNEPIVVIPLVSEAPTQIVDEIETTTIEKLLVDILSEEKLYISYQSEKSRIIHEAHTKYIINMNKLLRYARRRGKQEFIEEKIKTVIAQDFIEK